MSIKGLFLDALASLGFLSVSQWVGNVFIKVTEFIEMFIVVRSSQGSASFEFASLFLLGAPLIHFHPFHIKSSIFIHIYQFLPTVILLNSFHLPPSVIIHFIHFHKMSKIFIHFIQRRTFSCILIHFYSTCWITGVNWAQSLLTWSLTGLRIF